MDSLAPFREIWLIDFEFSAPDGERPSPHCMVARELRSGRLVRLWAGEMDNPPWKCAADVLIVAYYASAEFGCFIELGWRIPVRVLDLFAEFRNLTNGLPTVCGAGLLGALAYFGIDGMEAIEKEAMRELAIRGGPFADDERTALMDYCQSDVDALAKLLPVMLPLIDLPRALLRGRYMTAAARVEWNGIPVDIELLERLIRNWESLKLKLIDAVNADFGVYVPTGQREIDPQSTIGAAVLDTAAAWDIDPHKLLNAVDHVWQAERAAIADRNAAIVIARKRTGLTTRRINNWEAAGKDHSMWDSLDSTARDLADELPMLGIGADHRQEGGIDAADYGGALWELLREPATTKPRHDPDILNQAAAMVVNSPEAAVGPLSFSTKRFAGWLVHHGIPWPRLESGELDLSDETFRQMARQYPAVAPLRELRHTLGEMRLNSLAVGSDGRNRTLLSAFRARTGRNQPSNAKFLFGPSCWLRGLILPAEGRALAYIDWSAQEIAIAAKLSGDVAMQDAYLSGDPYFWLGKIGGIIPADATKLTHPELREVFKIVYLAANYGMGEKSLAQLIGKTAAHARELLRLHRERFPPFWAWSDGAVDHAMFRGWLTTVFGWRLNVGPDVKPTSLRNFPVQANGAEMLRLACCLATERGIQVCAPVHDALLVEGPDADMGGVVAATQAAMREASEIVLDGFALRTDAKVVRSGERYMDRRGMDMWAKIQTLLDEMDGRRRPPAGPLNP